MLRIPHCLESRLTDGGKIVSPTRRPHSTPQTDYFSASGIHFCQRLSRINNQLHIFALWQSDPRALFSSEKILGILNFIFYLGWSVTESTITEETRNCSSGGGGGQTADLLLSYRFQMLLRPMQGRKHFWLFVFCNRFVKNLDFHSSATSKHHVSTHLKALDQLTACLTQISSFIYLP
jgi:hypothetical protein